ncbi:MAG: hypothetical protein DRQ55_15255 [Planctomycetota bacterium]|nr:MAG: hypothetical protein DRQ55_15255 [Planctomycetota bacterium]
MNHIRTLLLTVLALSACSDPYATDTAPEGGAAESSPATRSGILSITLQVGDADVSPYECVFVMGRRASSDAFPELVKRLPPGPFPLTFELSARDLMGAGSMRGPWHISARLDHDGDAPFAKGDLQGATDVVVGDGEAHAELLMDVRVQEDAVVAGTLDTSLGGHGGVGGASSAGSLPPGHGNTLPAGHPVLDPPVDPHAGHDHAAEPHDEAPAAPDPHAGHDHNADGSEIVQLQPADGDATSVQVHVSLGEGVTALPGDLFVFARASATGKGMPLAVKRVPRPSFPVTLTIGLGDMPMAFDNAAELLAGTLFLSASLDADGNVTTKQDLDLVGGPIEATRDGVSQLTLAPRGEP